MELDALDFVAVVAQSHDDAVVGFGSDGKLVRQGFSFDNERVIAGGGERIGQFAENIFAVVMDLAGLAVEQLRGADDFAAESRADGLVAEADSKNGKLACQALD